MKDQIQVIVVAVILFAFMAYQITKNHQTAVEIASVSVSGSGLIQKVDLLQAKLDSVQSQNIGLGKSVIYLDSCQQVKSTKSEKAERRGRFVGGLLKTLFPHF